MYFLILNLQVVRLGLRSISQKAKQAHFKYNIPRSRKRDEVTGAKRLGGEMTGNPMFTRHRTNFRPAEKIARKRGSHWTVNIFALFT